MPRVNGVYSVGRVGQVGRVFHIAAVGTRSTTSVLIVLIVLPVLLRLCFCRSPVYATAQRLLRGTYDTFIANAISRP